MAKAASKLKKTAVKSKPSVAVRAKPAAPAPARKALKTSPAKPAPKAAKKVVAIFLILNGLIGLGLLKWLHL